MAITIGSFKQDLFVNYKQELDSVAFNKGMHMLVRSGVKRVPTYTLTHTNNELKVTLTASGTRPFELWMNNNDRVTHGVGLVTGVKITSDVVLTISLVNGQVANADRKTKIVASFTWTNTSAQGVVITLESNYDPSANKLLLGEVVYSKKDNASAQYSAIRLVDTSGVDYARLDVPNIIKKNSELSVGLQTSTGTEQHPTIVIRGGECVVDGTKVSVPTSTMKIDGIIEGWKKGFFVQPSGTTAQKLVDARPHFPLSNIVFDTPILNRTEDKDNKMGVRILDDNGYLSFGSYSTLEYLPMIPLGCIPYFIREQGWEDRRRVNYGKQWVTYTNNIYNYVETMGSTSQLLAYRTIDMDNMKGVVNSHHYTGSHGTYAGAGYKGRDMFEDLACGFMMETRESLNVSASTNKAVYARSNHLDMTQTFTFGTGDKVCYVPIYLSVDKELSRQHKPGADNPLIVSTIEMPVLDGGSADLSQGNPFLYLGYGDSYYDDKYNAFSGYNAGPGGSRRFDRDLSALNLCTSGVKRDALFFQYGEQALRFDSRGAQFGEKSLARNVPKNPMWYFANPIHNDQQVDTASVFTHMYVEHAYTHELQRERLLGMIEISRKSGICTYKVINNPLEEDVSKFSTKAFYYDKDVDTDANVIHGPKDVAAPIMLFGNTKYRKLLPFYNNKGEEMHVSSVPASGAGGHVSKATLQSNIMLQRRRFGIV